MRGETGHLGLSLSSCTTGGFCGVGACICGSLLAGRRLGVVDDRARGADVGSRILVLAGLDGLGSCWLFFRERVALPSRCVDELLRGFRAGEPSREAMGDWELELAADDCFEVCTLDTGAFADGRLEPPGAAC